MKKIIWLAMALCLALVMMVAFASSECAGGHHFDEDGCCTVCLYQCPHEHSEERDIWAEDTSYEEDESNDLFHYATGTLLTIDYCSDCGAKLEVIDSYSQSNVLSYHSYYDQEQTGDSCVCTLCQHVNQCQHDPDALIEYHDWLNKEDLHYQEIEGRNDAHMVSGSAHIYDFCTLCGIRINGRDIPDYVCEEGHTWSEETGDCRYCGHKNTCVHPDAAIWYEVDEDAPDRTVTETDDNRYHIIRGSGRRGTQCDECYAYFYTPVPEAEKQEEHDYDEETHICTVCGHECTHEMNNLGCCEICGFQCRHEGIDENIPEETEAAGFAYTEKDDSEHYVIPRTFHYRECPDCHHRAGYYTYSESIGTASHEYDSTGMCPLCMNWCNHSNQDTVPLETHVITRIIKENEYNHVKATLRESYKICPDCGMEIIIGDREIIEITENSSEPHDFDDDGDCVVCGYYCQHQFDEDGYCAVCHYQCPHEEWMIVERDEWGEGTTYTYYETDNLLHYASGTLWTIQYCEECGKEFSRSSQECARQPVGHTYPDHAATDTEPPRCTVCGHVNTCTHEEELMPDVEWIDELNNRYTEKQDDNVNHTLSGTALAKDYCWQCGMYINCRVVPDYSFDQMHTYDDSGTCTFCGHYNTCSHANAETKQFLYDEDETDIVITDTGDNRYHIASGMGCRYQYCEDCDTAFDKIEGIHINKQERHTYDDSVCSTCGHECTHDIDDNGYCLSCGFQYAQEGNDAEIEWYVYNGILTISGQGRMADYDDADQVPWKGFRTSIKQIIIGEDISYIGKNAFADINRADLRISFYQDHLPDADNNAFAGIDGAVCRYFKEDFLGENWSGSQYGGGENLSWIYLPTKQLEGSIIGVGEVLSIEYTDTGWYLYVDGEAPVLMTPAQIEEAAYDKVKAMNFSSIPTDEENQAVYAGWDQVSHISIWSGCTGVLEVPLKSDAVLQYVSVEGDSDCTLIIDDPRPAGLYSMTQSCRTSSVHYTGNIQNMRLNGSSTGETAFGSVTVDGNIDSLFIGDHYKGSLTISDENNENHKVRKAFLQGTGTLDIPNVGTRTIEGMVIASFSDATGQIMNAGTLCVEGTEPVTLTLDMYNLDYWFSGNDCTLVLYMKQDAFSRIAEGNSIDNFTVFCQDLDLTLDQIAWGQNTSVTLVFPDTEEYVEINGCVDEYSGNKVGVGNLSVRSGKVKVNCPVEYMHAATNPDLIINSDVFMLQIETDGGKITTGENGRIQQGYWRRKNRVQRLFGPVVGARTIYDAGNLQVMNWRWGEKTKALLPAEASIKPVQEQFNSADTTVLMDVGDSSITKTSEEGAALYAYLAENYLSEDAVISVFDASVTAYMTDADGGITEYGVSELKDPVDVVVSNPVNESCYIVRLHENNENGGEGISVDPVSTESQDQSLLPFSSNLFSKYVIIAGNRTLPENSITIPETDYGTVTAYLSDETEPADKAHQNDTVSLVVAPDTGYHLDTLTVTYTGGDDQLQSIDPVQSEENPSRYTFTMPAAPVTVTASFAHTHAFTYTAEGAVIIATCSNSGCGLEDQAIRLTLTVPEKTTYGDGNSANVTLDGLEAFNAETGLSLSDADVVYAGRNETLFDEGSVAPEGAGDYTASLTVDEATAAVEWSIASKSVASDEGVTAVASGAQTYNGEAQAPVLTVMDGETELTSGTDYVVSRYDGIAPTVYSSSDEPPIDAGLYSVQLVFTGNYTGTKDVAYTIDRKTVSLAWGSTEFEYNGEAWKPAAAVAEESLVSGDSCIVTVTGEQTEAGTGYIATATELSNANYKLPDTATVTFSIAKNDDFTKADLADSQKPTPADGLTYNASAQALVNAPSGTLPAGYTKVQYRLQLTDEWSDDIPTGTDVGDYTVYVLYRGDQNHADFEGDSVAASIAEADLECSIAVEGTDHWVLEPINVTLQANGANQYRLQAVKGSTAVDGVSSDASDPGAYTLTLPSRGEWTIQAQAGIGQIWSEVAETTITVQSKGPAELPTLEYSQFVKTGSSLVVSATPGTGSSTTTIELVDSNGVSIGRETVTEAKTVTFDSLSEGTYQLQVAVTPAPRYDPAEGKSYSVIVNCFTLSYDYTGNTPANAPALPADQLHEQNAAITPADIPALEGYSFSGWQNEPDIMPASDVTVTGSWTPVNYTIEYDLDGGALPNGKTNPTTYTIESNSITLNNPAKDGYIFIGWTGTGLSGATKDVTIPKGSTGNRAYVATYERAEDPGTITWTVTFDSAGGSNVDEQIVSDGGKAAKPADPSRMGYTFSGWYLGESGDPFDFETVITANITLTARWTEQQQPPEPQPEPQPDPQPLPPAGNHSDASANYTVNADGTATYKGPKKDTATVTIPATIKVGNFNVPVTKIADKAFKGKKKLKTVTIGSNIREIGTSAFEGCKKLKTVKGGDNVEKIGDKAYKGCVALTKYTIGAKVNYIGKNAFNGCTKLKTITIKSTLLTSSNVKSGAFKKINAKATFKVPKAKKKEYSKWLPKKGTKTVKVK